MEEDSTHIYTSSDQKILCPVFNLFKQRD